MTLKELDEYYFLRARVAFYNRKIADIRDRATSTVTTLTAEGSGGHGSATDKVGAAAAAIADLEKETLQYEAQIERVEAYIKKIDDHAVWIAIQARYVQRVIVPGRSSWTKIKRKPAWHTIAAANDLGMTGDTLRMRVKKYLATHPEE